MNNEIVIEPGQIYLVPRVVVFQHPRVERVYMEPRAMIDGVIFQEGLPLIYDKSGSGRLSSEYYALRRASGPKVDRYDSTRWTRVVLARNYTGHNHLWSEVPTK